MDLYDYEIEFKENSYYGNIENEELNLIHGNNNVIISVPHCYRHNRNNTEKPHEFMTGALGKYVQKQTNCHLIYTGKYLNKDSNWDQESNYRTTLNNYILENQNIKFLIDLHGTKNKKYDLIIGLNDLNNINKSKNYFKILKHFWRNKRYKVGYDVLFKASGENNICRNANLSTNVYALQFEISDEIRLDKEKSNLFAKSLVDFIHLLEKLIIIPSVVVSKRNESWWPLNYAIISKTYADRFNINDNDLLSLKRVGFETGLDLNIVVDENAEDNVMSVSPKTMNILKRKYNINDLLFRIVDSIPIKYIYKIDSETINDDSIFVNSKLYEVLEKNKFKYIKIHNTVLNIYATFKYQRYDDDKKRGSSIWLSQKNRSLLGIEMKNKYPWYEYDRIIKILKDESFMQKHTDKKYLLVFFQECYNSENGKIYSLSENIVEILYNNLNDNELKLYSLDDKDKFQLLYKIRKDFKKLFSLSIIGSLVNTSVKTNIILDTLVGLSKGKLLVGRIDDYLEGTNNVKINSLTASIFDICNNERMIIYNGRKSISCRVIISDEVNDMELLVPKNIRSKLNINQEKQVVSVKRDNHHIVFKKIDSIILTISLTIFSILTFFQGISNKYHWIMIVSIFIICLLTISSTFTERRRNVK